MHVKALAAAGLPALALYGLRRSFGTLAEWVECPAGVSAQIMGHKPSAIAEKHYRRRPLDRLRMWHTKIEDWILWSRQACRTRQDTSLAPCGWSNEVEWPGLHLRRLVLMAVKPRFTILP